MTKRLEASSLLDESLSLSRLTTRTYSRMRHISFRQYMLTSPAVTFTGLRTITTETASAKVSGKPFLKPISFYQIDLI